MQHHWHQLMQNSQILTQNSHANLESTHIFLTYYMQSWNVKSLSYVNKYILTLHIWCKYGKFRDFKHLQHSLLTKFSTLPVRHAAHIVENSPKEYD